MASFSELLQKYMYTDYMYMHLLFIAMQVMNTCKELHVFACVFIQAINFCFVLNRPTF